jgi:hypothetical protein
MKKNNWISKVLHFNYLKLLIVPGLIAFMGISCSDDSDDVVGAEEACGSFTIPIVAISIDGDISDWNGIQPVFEDAVNDQHPDADFDGTDLHKFYLARDETFLYMLITLYDGPPKTDIHTQYGFQAEQSSERHGTSGDHLAKAGFSRGRWYAGIHVRSSIVHGGQDIASYPSDYVETGANFIEWKVRLSDMGTIHDRYVWVYIHTFEISSTPEEPVNDDSEVCIQLKM